MRVGRIVRKLFALEPFLVLVAIPIHSVALQPLPTVTVHADPSPGLGQAVAPTQNKGHVLVSSVIFRNTFFKTKGCFLLSDDRTTSSRFA